MMTHLLQTVALGKSRETHHKCPNEAAIMTKTIGLISLPGWDDPAAQEITDISLDPVNVQTVMLAENVATYTLDGMAGTDEALMEAAAQLARNGCDLVACVGTSLGWAGQPNTNAARLRGRRIAAKAGVPMIMTGTAIIDMLGLLGARRPALACTYHPTDWKNAWHHYVFNTGLDVTLAQNFRDAGIVGPASLPEALRNPSPELIKKAVVGIAADAPDSDAIVVTGMGARTLNQIQALEAVVGMPVLGADTALYASLALAANLHLVEGCLGQITSYLTPVDISAPKALETK